MTDFWKITSKLKQENTIAYLEAGKGGKKKPVQIVIPGCLRPDDLNPEKNRVAPIYISDAQYKALIAPEHGGAPSPFSFFMDEGEAGRNGIFVKPVDFADMPDEFQKQFDSDKHAKLKAAREKLARQDTEDDK